MMRVFWEEWRAGSAFASVRVLPLAVIAAALGLLITRVHPGSVFLVLVFLALAGGVLSGTQRWGRVLARDWVSLEKVSPWGYAAGKIVGLVALFASWTAFLFPALLLAALVWGFPWQAAMAPLAWVLAAAFAAQALGHAVSWSDSEFQRVVGALAAFLWVTATFQSPLAQPYNPIWQVWHSFHNPEAPFDAVAWSAVLIATGLIWAVIAAVLRREGRA